MAGHTGFMFPGKECLIFDFGSHSLLYIIFVKNGTFKFCTFSAKFLLTERHSLFDASDMLETFDNNNGTSTTPTSTATSGQEESPLPESGKFKFLKKL